MALAGARAAYAAFPGRLEVARDPEAGREETAAMRGAVLEFFETRLLGGPGLAGGFATP